MDFSRTASPQVSVTYGFSTILRNGAEQNRTANLFIANEALYQLSYGPPKESNFIPHLPIGRNKGRLRVSAWRRDFD